LGLQRSEATFRRATTSGIRISGFLQDAKYNCRSEGINLRGVFSFPIEQYAEQLLPSLAAIKSRAAGA
jgi:hypothetical protein